ncbi:pescadillo [Tanacetum coccineum]
MPKHYRPAGKKKEGNAARYVTRSQAVKYLQVPLKVFRSKDLEGKRHQGRWKKIVHDQNQREVATGENFVRLKAQVDGQKVTWLTPHALQQVMPQDVDYKIMLTFLEFYETLLGSKGRESLLFVITSFGGVVSWEGDGAPFEESNRDIDYQPQWVFDCINARIILPTEDYLVGKVLPPHLSPFVDNEAEGYVPKAEAKEAAERKRKMAIDEKQLHQELKTEMKGMQKTSDTTEIKKSGEEDDADDASPKQLIKDDESRAMVTMSRRKQRLYEAMQISKERKKGKCRYSREEELFQESAPNDHKHEHGRFFLASLALAIFSSCLLILLLSFSVFHSLALAAFILLLSFFFGLDNPPVTVISFGLRSNLSQVSLRSRSTVVGLIFLWLGAARSFAAPRSSRSHIETFFLSFFLILLAATFFPFDHQVINLDAFLLVVFLSFSVFWLLPSFPKDSSYLSAAFVLVSPHADQK